MNCSNDDMLLYAVTDRRWLIDRTLYEAVEAALRGGVSMIQLREKNPGAPGLLEEARALAGLCTRYRVPFVVNDNICIAKGANADGVHLGQSDMDAATARALLGPDKIIGVSVQTVAQAKQALKDGADYLGVGAVFPTGTKADADYVSRETLMAICREVPLPICAIGGIMKENLLSLKGSGVHGVALVSAVFGQGDVEAACRALLPLCREMVAP